MQFTFNVNYSQRRLSKASSVQMKQQKETFHCNINLKGKFTGTDKWINTHDRWFACGTVVLIKLHTGRICKLLAIFGKCDFYLFRVTGEMKSFIITGLCVNIFNHNENQDYPKMYVKYPLISDLIIYTQFDWQV